MCNPPEIWQLVDDMLIAQAQWLPQYETAIAEAEKRQRTQPRIPINEEYQGAARKKTRNAEELAADREEADKQAAEADKG